MSFKNSLVRLLSLIWTGVDGLRKVLHLFVMMFVFALLVSALSDSTPSIPSSAALVIQPAGTIVEQLAGDPFDRALAEVMGDAPPQTLLKDIVDALAYAKDDDRISSVILNLSAMPGGGLSKLKQVADALVDFRESGKPVIATADYFGQGSYYLAAHADEVYMHPDGAVFLSGFGAYQNFYQAALEKLKVDWNVFRVGTYKAAVEPYLRNDMSPEYRESLSSVLEQIWATYQSDIEVARNLDTGTVERLLSDLVGSVEAAGGDIAKLALETGFVDGLVTRREFREIVIDVAGEGDEPDTYPAAGLPEYLQQMRLLHGDGASETNIAVVVGVGEILNGSQSPGLIGGDSTAQLLRAASNDESVKAIVFRVDSPGGSAFASEVILNEIDAIKASGKPVVVSMSSVAASGGYWVSMAADRIYATPYTITGSIGIFGMFPTIQRSLETLGVSTDGVGTTPWAGELRVDREMSADAKAMFQLSIEEGYDDFISGVAENRELDKMQVDSIGQGRIWTGVDAYEKGLVDELGNLNDAIKAAADLAGISDVEYGKKYFEQEISPSEQLALNLLSGIGEVGIDVSVFARSESSLERLADLVANKLSPLTRFNDPKGHYAHCFCRFE